jgi:glycosyltransferase involved in cell wall biosynthesis
MLHAYPPYHNAGAESYVHQLHRWLVGRGHEVQVLQRDPIAGPSWDGVKTGRRGPPRWVDRITSGKLILTHLDETPIAENAAGRTGSPLVHILHNDQQLDFHNVRRADLIVANSDWIAETIPDRFASTPTAVLYPPTFCADYETDPRERVAVTLVNLTREKGAHVFYELARRLPDRPFYAVTGAYGVQVPKPRDLDNVRPIRNRPNMAPVWDETRLYLQPSSYESYGKAAVEALASGIPVIAHPTEGLRESLGPAGVFVDRDDLDGWETAIRELDDPETYALASKAARARAEELEARTVAQLRNVETFLEELSA